MHPSVLEWTQHQVNQWGLAGLKTLECGSRNYNGTVRPLFNGEYVGIDMADGPDVDIVALAADMPFADEEFETVISTEMMEHDPCFWLSIPEMARVLKPGGHMLITTRGIGFPYHEYPGDFWRFTEDSIRLLFETNRLVVIKIEPDWYPGHPGVFGIARKPLNGTERKERP